MLKGYIRTNSYSELNSTLFTSVNLIPLHDSITISSTTSPDFSAKSALSTELDTDTLVLCLSSEVVSDVAMFSPSLSTDSVALTSPREAATVVSL